MYETMAILAAFALVFSAVAGRIERSGISGPIVFTVFGVLFGPRALDLLRIDVDAETLRLAAELTLALVLFSDAAGTNLRVLRRFEQLPIRLLAIGLPLTILLGIATGMLLFDALTFVEVALLATMLAPTDAALGKGVVTNEDVPDPIRQGLNVESGLNDGICVPILFLFLALAEGEAAGESPWQIGMGALFLLEAVGIGLAAGLLPTAAAVLLLRAGRRRGWLAPAWTKITVLALAFTCFAAAQALGGSGFIACFAGGMLFGGMMGPAHEEFLDAAEGIGDLFALLTWVLFGAAVVGSAFSAFSWSVVAYALLSLTAIRMLPVLLALGRSGMPRESRLFVGWFGPRGLASIVFVVLVSEADLPHFGTLAEVVAWTVMLSILLHGVTANAWARRLGRHVAARNDGD